MTSKKKNSDKNSGQQSKEKSQSPKSSNGVIKGKLAETRNQNGALVRKEMSPKEIKAEHERNASGETKRIEEQKAQETPQPRLVEQKVLPGQDAENLAMQKASQITETPLQKAPKLAKETKAKSDHRVLGLWPSNLKSLSAAELSKIELKPDSLAAFLNEALSEYDNKTLSADDRKRLVQLALVKFPIKESTASAQAYRTLEYRQLAGKRAPPKTETKPAESKTNGSPAASATPAPDQSTTSDTRTDLVPVTPETETQGQAA